MATRGRHTVYLGMAPGVGKTYTMLDEGHEELERGRDVVIGFLETHGRPETQAQAEGLETIPRRLFPYRGTTLEEMDLPAILARAPELCLIDELAHSNVPGTEHAKRYEDVDAVLAAGIDVYSTVNVQHVETLASRVGDLVGVRIRETLPARVLDDADDVVLVDVPPELLLERLVAGKIFRDGSTEIAQRGFFRPETLATLRELALLHVAEEAEPTRRAGAPLSRRGRSSSVSARRQPAQTSERVLALATPDPWQRPIVHHAYRFALGLTAAFDVLWVRTGPEADAVGDLGALERLVSTLGGTLRIRDGGQLVAGAVEAARELEVTHLVIGRPRTRTALGRLAHRRLPLALMRELPDVDVLIVALADRRDVTHEAGLRRSAGRPG